MTDCRSIHVSTKLLSCPFILFLSLVSIFTTIAFNSLSGTLSVSLGFFFFPWILVLIFCLKHILMSYYFVWLSLFVFITLGIISYLPSLKIHCYVGVVSHSGFQSQPRGLVFLMLDLRTGVPNVVLKQLFFFRKDSQAHDVRSLLPPWCPLLGHLQGIWVPTRLLLFPSYPSQSVFFFSFFLYFSLYKSHSVFFRFFSELFYKYL